MMLWIMILSNLEPLKYIKSMLASVRDDHINSVLIIKNIVSWNGHRGAVG